MDNSDIIKKALECRRKLEVFSYSLTRDWGLAEDAVQDAYVILYKKQGNLSEDDNVYGWLKKIVRDKSIDIIRKQSRYATYDSSLMDLVEQSFEQHDPALQTEKLKSMCLVLDECVRLLSSEDAGVLQKFYLKKSKCEKIAEESKTTVNAIRLKLSRLRAKLRKCTQLKLSVSGEL